MAFDKLQGAIIGLGSMGRRRIRCLEALGNFNLYGYDKQTSRMDDARNSSDISICSNLQEVFDNNLDFCIISVPPKDHIDIMSICLDNGIPFFVEASVISDGLEIISKKAKEKKLLAAPSCTLRYHPAIKEILKIVKSLEFGQISNFTLHSGQYLPDWHQYESVSNFYVSEKETGGAREIVPFELTWLTEVFGFPNKIAANFGKTIDIKGAQHIDDTYNILLNFGDFFGNLTVDVVSRLATRRLMINFKKAQLIWDWERPEIIIYTSSKLPGIKLPIEVSSAADGYNKNITEEMYINELHAFLLALTKNEKYPNTLDNDIKILNLLELSEKSSQLEKTITV
jgi:predicted dehydrogenase